jgi:hypothetical protein
VCLCLTGGGFVGWWGSEESYTWTDVLTPRILLSYVPGVQADQVRGFWEVRGYPREEVCSAGGRVDWNDTRAPRSCELTPLELTAMCFAACTERCEELRTVLSK